MVLSGLDPEVAPASSRSAIRVERIVDCPFSLAVDEAHVIFQMLESETRGVRVPFRKLGLPFGGGPTHRVATHFHRQRDKTEPGRIHEEVEFGWSAQSRWLPDLHGVLRFRIAALKTRVILNADYVPPGGALGSFFDRIFGRHLARATAQDVVDRLAVVLERRWAAQRDA